jgi:hypothetical protein
LEKSSDIAILSTANFNNQVDLVTGLGKSKWNYSVLKTPSLQGTIIDGAGRAVLHTRGTEHIDVSSLPSGVYQLLLTSVGEMRAQRFVIAR